jgi:hypothetical protein
MMVELASIREEFSMKIIPLSRHRDRRILAEFARAIGAKASGEHFERCVDLIYEARRGSAEIVEQFRRDTEQLKAEAFGRKTKRAQLKVLDGLGPKRMKRAVDA